MLSRLRNLRKVDIFEVWHAPIDLTKLYCMFLTF